MKKYLLSLFVTLAVSNICFSQRDASLTYIDLIAKNNQQVKESNNQYIINWDEVPFNLRGVASIKETYYSPPFDESVTTDTTIVIDTLLEPVHKVYSLLYEFHYLEDDTLEIIIDTSFIVTYVKDRIISQKEDGVVMDFNYYPSGLLKGLIVDGHPFLVSEQIKDTTHYRLNLIDPLTKKPIESSFMPTIEIRCTNIEDADCFHYENIFLLEKMSKTPIVNKEIVQCKSGNITKEIILDRHKNYTQKQRDYEYEYEGSLLKNKICKPEVPYAEFGDIAYEYDTKGNLTKVMGATITAEYDYDDRNNVISRLEYMTGSKRLRKLWTREIEYQE